MLRLRVNCKKVIVSDETKYTFVLNDCNSYDQKKLLERELYVIKNHIEHMNQPEFITKIKSFVNASTLQKEEILNENFTSRQIVMLDTKLNDITVRSNIKIATLVNKINQSNNFPVILYVKLHKNTVPNTYISLLEVCGVEVIDDKQKESPNKTDLIVNMIKSTRKSQNEMF